VPPRAITLDLDETLWPIWPVIARAEQVLHAWLYEHAPVTAQTFDTAGLRRLREQVGREHPQRSHDLTWLRQHSIERALRQCGEDPALAAPAFELFFAERQKVQLFADVPAALERLAARVPLLALTNGNADLARIGLAPFFQGVLGAREFGVGKPAPAFFHAACARLCLAPAQVLHVGDDWALDIEGAHAAGLPSVWIHRPGHAPKPAQVQARPWAELNSLAELVQRLGWH
jgi:2-haloalkanoic acid dehalogenase type II